jgi:hypothetical protein
VFATMYLCERPESEREREREEGEEEEEGVSKI